MQKVSLITMVIVVLAVGFFLGSKFFAQEKIPQNSFANSQNVAVNDKAGIVSNQEKTQVNSVGEFQPPLDQANERVTKKPFGIFITPQNSPVQPEKFRGYHTGVDFEIFPGELKTEVAVHAVCSGELALKEYASGYGGVVAQRCDLNGKPITVVYGHLKLTSISKSVGEKINAGDALGILGADKSNETNGERKHLHLGFHKGSTLNIRGYVSSKGELTDWIDPCQYVCQN